MNGMYFDQMKQYIPNLNNLLNIIISAIHSLVNSLLMYTLKGTCKDSIKQYILNMNYLLNIIFFYVLSFYHSSDTERNIIENSKLYHLIQ
jgi:hypothetical protein